MLILNLFFDITSSDYVQTMVQPDTSSHAGLRSAACRACPEW